MIQPSKNLNSIIVAGTFMASMLFLGCDSSNQKVDAANNNVTQTKENFAQAQDNYQSEVESFKNESNQKISDNEKIIEDLKSKMNSVKKESQEAYKKQIAVLEQKNEEIKIRLEGYKYDSKENWESFKMEFNHNMKELGNSIKDISIKINK